MDKNNFGFLKRNFFPVHQHEYKKVVPMNMLFFLVAGIYGMLRMMKDTYVIPTGGGEIIAAIKFYVILPLMLVAKIIYDGVSKRLGRDRRMYALLGYFFVFFLAFHFVLQGYSDRVKAKDSSLGHLSRLLAMWPHVLFYFHAEAWGTFALSVGCWAFANAITHPEQAKRCYSTFSIGTGLATTMAGLVGLTIGKEQTLLLGLVSALILLAGIVYYFFVRAMAKTPEAYQLPQERPKKQKLGVLASLKASFHSKHPVYIFLVFTLVFGYAIAINLFELVYKDMLKEEGARRVALGLYNKSGDYVGEMMSYQLIFIGLASLACVFFLAAPVRRQGWRFTALFLPVTMLLGSMLFFSLTYWKEFFGNLFGCEAGAFKQWIIFIAMGVVVFVKSAKYVLFDTSKEAVYLPLDSETKLTGKSLVDGLGARIGKASGSFYYKSITKALVPVGATLVAAVTAWICAVVSLSRRYGVLLAKKEQEEQAMTQATRQSEEAPKATTPESKKTA